MKSYSTREVLKILKADGWYETKRKPGDHIQLKHPVKPNKVTVPDWGKDIPINILKDIEKKAGVNFD